MANIRELIPLAERNAPPLSGNVYGYLVAPIPEDATQMCYVVMPDISNEIRWGPMRWPKQAISLMILNAQVLVTFDNRQTPWVVAVW